MKKELIVTAPVSLSMLNDIIITAVEGGSNYWYLFKDDAMKKISKYKGTHIPEIHGDATFFYGTFTEVILPAVFNGESLPIYDIEDETEQIGVLSWDSIQKGLHKMTVDKRSELMLLINPEADYDAGDADVVFQYITLGEIVYG